jgi:translation initiation factor 3 subunit K
VSVVCQVLMKALCNLPHTDFTLCVCLLSQVVTFQSRPPNAEQEVLDSPGVRTIRHLAVMLETCRFKEFWAEVHLLSLF